MFTSLSVAAALFLHPGPHAGAAQDETARPQGPVQERASLGKGLYAITGRGGNILFFTGEDGTFVVDDQYPVVASANLALIEEVSEAPLSYVLNTHYHGDHTGGNPAFAKAGATLIATARVRERLAAGDSGEALSAPGALPVITFTGETGFHLSGQTVRAIPVPAAHTDGDSLAYFEEADVLHTGDVLFSGLYPYIDLEAGGSVSGMIAALGVILEVAGPDTVIVPGHGPVGGREAAQGSLTMLKDAKARIETLMEQGLSREEVITEKPLADYDEGYSWRFIGPERMAGQVFDSLELERGDAPPAP